MAISHLTPEEKAERAEALKASARQALSDYHEEKKRVEDNTARLRALRLAKEAEAAEPGTAKKVARKGAATRA